jgi:hypothetical protein
VKPVIQRILPICALLVAVTGPATAQTYYKWTDDAGTVHVTEQPPANRDYETVDIDTGRLGNADVAAATETPADDASGARAAMPRRAEPDPEELAARCEQARANLFWLQSKQRIRVEGDDGSQRYIDQEERQQMIDEAQALIDEWCSDDG